MSTLDLLAFILPAVSFLEVTMIGRLIVSEIILLVLLPWLWRARDRLSLPTWFVLLWAGWLGSQVVTDLVVGSEFRDLARGWAGIFFTLTNFVGILALASTPRRARLFAVGLAAGGLLGYLFVPHPNADGDPWKWAFALPIAFTAAAAVSGRIGSQWRWLPIGALLALGSLNLVLGYRSLGGVSLVTSAYLVLSAVVGRLPVQRSPLRGAMGLLFLIVVGIGVMGAYSALASQGLLGREAQDRYFDQAGALGVVLGGRSEALVSTQAILDSPILGHGSWAKDPAYAELLAERQTALGYEITPDYVGGDLIPAHSYFLGAWVWAGALGAAFWLAVSGVALWLLANLYSYRLAVAPLLVFSTLFLLWNIAFSPYGHSGRIMAPFGIALCILGLRLMREERGRLAPRRLGSRGMAPSP